MRYQKGQSGNPGGRPKLPDGVPTRAEALASFARLMPSAIKAIEDCLTSDDEKIRLRAAEIVVERNLGRVKEAPDDDKPDDGKVDTVAWTPVVVTTTTTAMVPKGAGDAASE